MGELKVLEDANLLNNNGESGKNRTTNTYITVDGLNYATNLFWQPIQNANDFMEEIEEASSSIIEGADLFAVKEGKAPQFGICVAQEGYKVGTNVAAISLMTALSNYSSIVGVFKVGEGWWYVCSRNDVILSDGDMLYLDEEEAKEQLLSMLTVPDWDKKFAPPEWNIEDTEKGDIYDIINRGKRVKLQKIKALRGSKLIMVIAASVIAGWWILSSLFDFIMAPPKRKIVTPVKPKVVKTEPVVIPKPWESMKSPEEFMTNCYQGVMDMATLMPPGWTSSGKISCTGSTVATSWKKGFGLLAWADETMRNSEFKNLNYRFDEKGVALSATLMLPKISKISMPPKQKMADLRFELNKAFQELGIKVSLGKKMIKLQAPKRASQTGKPSPMAKKGPLGKGGKGGKAVTMEIPVLTFKIKSEYNPVTWLKFLTKFSSFEINNIEYATNSSTWDYEGVFYVL